MFNRLSSKFVTIVTKSYLPNQIFIQPTYKFTVLQSKYPVQTHILTTCSYSTMNLSQEVSEYYKNLHDKELNSLLKDPKYKAMYQKYSLEIEYTKHITGRVPKNLTSFNWLYLLQTTTKSERRSYINFLFKLDMKKQHEMEKKLLKAEEIREDYDNCDTYGLHRCTMFHRIRPQTMNRFYNGRLINAMLYEPVMVIDVGYDEYMSPHERMACAKQLLLLYSTNRIHDSPFNLYFCNINKDSITMKTLHKVMPSLYEPEFPLNVTSKCYLEMFDKDKLVYLTPHTRTLLTKYDANLIYIIGAMVDKRGCVPLSYQKAKEQGIKMMKLPLSEKLQWGSGSSKALPLNQVLSIMLDLKYSKNWNVALGNIPKRKLQKTIQNTKLLKNAKALDYFYRNRM